MTFAGRARTDGLGTDTLAVGDGDGFVILQFEKPVSFVKLDPATAKGVAEHMLQRCYKATFGDFPAAKKGGQAAEQLRIKLRNRVELMLRSMSTEAPVPSHKIQAQRIVDTCLREAT